MAGKLFLQRPCSRFDIQDWTKVWNVFFYSEIAKHNVTKLCETIDGIVADVSVVVSCVTEGRSI